MANPNQPLGPIAEKDPRDRRDHEGQAHGQEGGRGPATQVNHSAGLDPDFSPEGGQPPTADPYDDAMAIRGLFGSVHNELNELNSRLVEQSSGLKAKTINKEVMDRDILNLVGATKTDQPQQQNMGQGGIDIAASQNIPYAMNASGIGNMPSPEIIPNDPNQIEFNFDNSATAKDIFNKLHDIEEKICSHSKDLKLLIELLDKK